VGFKWKKMQNNRSVLIERRTNVHNWLKWIAYYFTCNRTETFPIRQEQVWILCRA
jgi:hypothetical protein